MQKPTTQVQLTLENSTGFQCECGSVFFKQSLLIRKWSKLLIGQPEDHIEPIPVFRCEDCGEVLKAFFPRGMKDIEETLGLGDPIPEKPKATVIQFQ